MEEIFEEYVTFHVTASDGSDVEMAVVDEFDFEDKHYVVGAVVTDDTIDDEGRYIYESIMDGDDFTVKKIAKEFDYRRIAQAYEDMDEDEEDDLKVSSNNNGSICVTKVCGRHFFVIFKFFVWYVSCVYKGLFIGFLKIAYIFPGGFGIITRISSLKTLLGK